MTSEFDPTKGLEPKGSNANERGNQVERYFDGSIDRARYHWDFKPGWEQFDTHQDAWYFGVWVNKETMQIWSYVEGDFIVTTCPTVEQFNLEVLVLCEFYEPGFIAKTIDQSGTQTWRQDRSEFLIGEGVKDDPMGAATGQAT